jgi:uncharacterized protein (DUF1330 family)
MTAYILAQLKFTDRAAYDRYQSRFMSVFRQFKGSVLIADEHPQVIEGEWHRDKVVLLAFPDEQEAIRFHNAPDYVEIAQDRRAGAQATVLLLKGFGGRPAAD